MLDQHFLIVIQKLNKYELSKHSFKKIANIGHYKVW